MNHPHNQNSILHNEPPTQPKSFTIEIVIHVTQLIHLRYKSISDSVDKVSEITYS